MFVRFISIFLLGLLTNISLSHAGDFKPLKGQTAVRVCADAYNLPYSNKKLEGFDNKIAALIGEELGIPVEYYWFPQRIGFGRNTIKKVDPKTGRFLCDLAMSIPAGPGRYLTTKPYFSSIDTMVYRSGEGYELNKISDIAKLKEQGKKLKIGLFDRAIETEALLANGLADQIEYYQFMPGDTKVYAGRLVEDELAKGNVDVVFLWGPIASYYAQHSDVPMTVVPLNELGEDYVFSFAMGGRKQDKAWRDLLNDIMEARKDDITAIMSDYKLPSIANVEKAEHKRKLAYTVVDGKVDHKTYVGWRLFNSTCFVCHGKNATGTERAPNLVEKLAKMSAYKFRKKVLGRYFGLVNFDDPESRMAYLGEQVGDEQAAQFKMPTWDDDPNIRAHVDDLYAYLKARADGVLGEGRPEKLEE